MASAADDPSVERSLDVGCHPITGVLLLASEIIEMFMIPFHPIMHRLLIAASLAILILAWSCRGHLKVRD